MISIDDFVKVKIQVGMVVDAEELEGSEKLLKLTVDFGSLAVSPLETEEERNTLSETDSEILHSDQDDINDGNEHDIRQVLSGIKQWYAPEDLKGKQFVFVTNLAPRKMMGLESQAMIMAAEGEDKPVLLIPSGFVPNGAKIR